MQARTSASYSVTYSLDDGVTNHALPSITPYQRTDGAVQERINVPHVGTTMLQKKSACVNGVWINMFMSKPTVNGHKVRFDCKLIEDQQ